MKIVQITEHDECLYGLADDGELYRLVDKSLGFGLSKTTWEKHCIEYGPALSKSVLDQVVDFIKGNCYTSTNLFEALKNRYGNGAFVVSASATELVMQSNDKRVIVSVICNAVPVHVEDGVKALRPAIEVTTTDANGGQAKSALLVNKNGGRYERA